MKRSPENYKIIISGDFILWDLKALAIGDVI